MTKEKVCESLMAVCEMATAIKKVIDISIKEESYNGDNAEVVFTYKRKRFYLRLIMNEFWTLSTSKEDVVDEEDKEEFLDAVTAYLS